MSANRDKSNRYTFLFENLYKINRNSQEDNGPVSQSGNSIRIELNKQSRVIKAAVKATVVEEYTPPKLDPKAALSSLKTNLQTLQELHLRLKFLMMELEDLSGKKKK